MTISTLRLKALLLSFDILREEGRPLDEGHHQFESIVRELLKLRAEVVGLRASRDAYHQLVTQTDPTTEPVPDE